METYQPASISAPSHTPKTLSSSWESAKVSFQAVFPVPDSQPSQSPSASAASIEPLVEDAGRLLKRALTRLKVVPWDEHRDPKGKGREIWFLEDDESSLDDPARSRTGSQHRVKLNRIPSASHMAAHPSLGGCPFSARAFHLKFSLPPSRRDFLWVPDIPHPEWGMPLSITELEPHAYSDKDLPRWYFERPDVQPLLLHRTTSRHGCAAEDSIKPRKQRKTNDGLMELWKGEWHKMGRCFSILPPPYEHHTRFWNLPPLSSISETVGSVRPFKVYPFPLSTSPPLCFASLRPGDRRGKWLIPVHGPVLSLPTSPSLADGEAVSDAILSESVKSVAIVHDRLCKRKKTRGDKGLQPPSVGSNRLPAPPATILWTPHLLTIFRDILLKLQSKATLGPVSFVLHASTIPPPPSSSPSSSSFCSAVPTSRKLPLFSAIDPTGGSDEEAYTSPVVLGDHWRIHVDLAYALRIRWLLGEVQVRVERDSPTRVRPLLGARLVLVDDEERVICLA